MSERLTVVFDDPNLYRRLKIAAAEGHLPIKRLVEDAIRAYLGPELPAVGAFDWNAYDRWQEEVAELNAGIEEPGGARILTLPVRYDRDDDLPRNLHSMGEEPAVYGRPEPEDE